jgi:hypothetical protein
MIWLCFFVTSFVAAKDVVFGLARVARELFQSTFVQDRMPPPRVYETTLYMSGNNN